MALVLAEARKLRAYDRETRAGVWRWQSGQPIHRLRGRGLGLLSFGAIAQAIAARAARIGMVVIASDPNMDPAAREAQGVDPVSVDQLVERSDFLVIQAPLTPDTHHLFNEARLRGMKRSAVLINTARGPIVEDAALYRALKDGWIAGAGLDDIEEEPAKQRDWRPTNALFSLDNVIITPHAAYYSEEAMRTVREFAAHEVLRVLSGQAALSPVNVV